MKKNLILLIVMLVIACNINAEEVAHGNITFVEKGDPAPYAGYVVDESQMKHFRQINEEKKLLEKKTIKLEELGIRQEDSKEWYKNNYYKVKEKYEWQQTKSFWTNTLYFVGGAVLTGLISYGTVKTLDR